MLGSCLSMQIFMATSNWLVIVRYTYREFYNIQGVVRLSDVRSFHLQQEEKRMSVDVKTRPHGINKEALFESPANNQ
jgi:hypothetical protein